MVNTRSRSKKERALASAEDRIGALPDELLQHVMSFLLSRDAVQTCVLARRWRTLWKSVPALRIEDDPATDSNKFMDELLRLRDPAPLNVCDICVVSEDSDTDEDEETFCEEASNRIAPWLRYALLHEVRVLQVSAPVLPTDLVLVSSHLKRIELSLMQFDEDYLDFSSCQVLDVLEMTDCNIYASIFSQSLRHLNMKGGCFDNEIRFRISAPNLISLKLAPESGLTPLLDSMPSLVTASVESSEEEFHYCFASSCQGCEMQERSSVVLEGLSAATNLELTSDDLLSVFRMDFKWCPVFSKLKMLLLNKWCVAGDFTGLIYFLQHSPVLETLTLQLNIPTHKKQRVNETDERYTPKKQSLLSDHLKIVKIICGTMKEDARVYRALKMLSAHGVPSEKIDIQ